MSIKSSIREWVRTLGYNITRQAENPEHNLVGLRNIAFDVIFDVGANEGQFASRARALFPHARIHCFEPTAIPFEKLKLWCAQDGNAVAVQSALGEESGSLSINFHTDHSPSSSLLPTTSRSEELYPATSHQTMVDVCVQRLDDYVASLPSFSVRHLLLKLDVQGYEANVLKGALQTLNRAEAAIVEVCLEPLYEGQGQFPEVIKLMAGAGLRYAGNVNQAYASDGRVIYLDAAFIR